MNTFLIIYCLLTFIMVFNIMIISIFEKLTKYKDFEIRTLKTLKRKIKWTV